MSEENKRAAIAYFEKAINGFDTDTAMALYGGKNYKQHNPLIEDDWAGLKKFVGWLRDNHPRGAAFTSSTSSPTEILSYCIANGSGPREKWARPS
jgi:predicted SnoaL-like aldol condensation-catalyzing enzyme